MDRENGAMKTRLLVASAMFVLGPAGLGATSGQAAVADLSQSGLLMTVDSAAIDGGARPDEYVPLVAYDVADQGQLVSASSGEGPGAEQDAVLAHAPISQAPDLLPWVAMLLVFGGLGFSGYRKARKSETAFDLS
jgi:hypothetical protein